MDESEHTDESTAEPAAETGAYAAVGDRVTGILEAAEEAAAGASAWAAQSGLIVPEVQAALLRDIFNVAQPQPRDQLWLAWQDGMIPIAAEALKDSGERRLPAGCD